MAKSSWYIDPLYKQFKELRSQFNRKMKTVSKTSQGYKAFQKGIKDIFGSKTRITKYMPEIAFYRDKETAVKAIKFMEKMLQYNSITEQDQFRIDELKRKSYESDVRIDESGKEVPAKDLSYDELMDWIKDSEHFSDFINAFDSDQAIGYAHKLYEMFGENEGKGMLDSIWSDTEGLLKSEMGAEYLESLKKSEKDEMIAEKVAKIIEWMTSKIE